MSKPKLLPSQSNCSKCGKPLKRVSGITRCEDCKINFPEWFEASPYPDNRPRDYGHILPTNEDN